MKLTVVKGYIFPTHLPEIEEGKYSEVTKEEHEEVLDAWKGRVVDGKIERLVYKDSGGSVYLTPNLEVEILEAIQKTNQMSNLNAMNDKALKESKKSAKKVKSIIGKPKKYYKGKKIDQVQSV